ncbi:porin [Rudaea sp.]|uniref:porin n=1 Tax=Rudaea sp. TaxID=2136325 RepID=UPI002ED2DEDE
MKHYNKRAATAAKKSVLCTAVLAGLAMSANALAADDGTLTWNGVTLYGVVDIGVAYQSHGAPLSQDIYVGLDYLVSKNGNKSTTSLAPSGLSQSKVGLKGTEKLTDDLDFVFNLEMGFNPTSGKLADAPASLIHNNGLAITDQKTGADGSRAGQVFNGPAFGGISSKEFGTLTLGRHNTVLADVIGKDDPQGGSYAFSVIGYSGATAGGGNTENVRADNSIKYNYKYQNFRVAAMWQFGKNDGSPGDGGQVSVGADFGGLSVDGVYAFKNTSIAAGSLSAAQIAPCTGTKVPPACGLSHDSLAATISDNESWTLAANYKLNDQWKLFGGYEHITYSNPSNPLAAGFDGLGGYAISVTNNNAYAFDKKLQVSWIGAKFQLNKEWSLTGGYYHYDQNDYHSVVQNGVAVRAPCSNTSFGQCSGNLDAFSFVADYRFTKRFDTYAGVMYSKVADGLANGYLHDNNTNVMAGFRFQF